ncbi:MAG: FAD-binding protein [Campylobacteraceae bacterium]
MVYDIAIIGLGPAGSTLARNLSRDLKVAAVDMKSLDGKDGFKKPCGGLLAPDAQRVLAEENLTLPNSVLANPQIFCVNTLDLGSSLKRKYQRTYINMNRHKFDLWLASLIPSDVRVFDRSKCLEITKVDNHFKVVFTQNKEKKEIFAKYVVGADGANSYVRKKFFKTPIRQYVCIQKTFLSSHSHDVDYVCFFDKDITDCYGWIDYKDAHCQMGVALPKKHTNQNFKTLQEKLTKRGFFFDEEVYKEACLVNSPTSINELVCGKDGIFLVGEAAGFISPSSLEGISYAMDSGRKLATVLNQNTQNPNKEYEKSCRKLKLKIALKILKAPFILNSKLRWLVMKSGASSLNGKNTH